MMSTTSNALLGIAFCFFGFSTTFLMFHLWGYPFDKATRTSSAPRSLMRLHRLLGFCFVIAYLIMMVQMVPRLWEYQVEFPPRTVAHILLGFTIGFILLIKISIIRFFRHLEEWMPYLGVGLLLCTVLLLGLSLPFVYKESRLSDMALSSDRVARVGRLLTVAEFPDDAPLEQLATKEELLKGREVLLRQCVRCHDSKDHYLQAAHAQSVGEHGATNGRKTCAFRPDPQARRMGG